MVKAWHILVLAAFALLLFAVTAEQAHAYTVTSNDCVGCENRYYTYLPYTNYYYGSNSYGYNGWGFNRVHYSTRFPYYRHYYPYQWHYPYAYTYFPSPMYRNSYGMWGAGPWGATQWGYGPFGHIGGYGGYGTYGPGVIW